jgi:hypothetical protein
MNQTRGRGRDEASAGAPAQVSPQALAAAAPLCQPSVDNELERLDGHRGCHYVPMDVFIDAPTRRVHFRASAIRARLARLGWFQER